MGKSRKNANGKHGIFRLKELLEKLRKSFSLCQTPSENDTGDEVWGASGVPDDVKEGYFAVSVINGGTPKRFVVALGYLNHPEFLKLLEKAEEEFGFEQQGALAVPCLASDLQSILSEKEASDNGEWEIE